MKQPKVVVSGYIGFDNFGDESIFTVLCKNLKQQNAQITAISANPKKTAQLYNINSCKTFDLLAIFSAIFCCDVLISGGGSLLQDKTSLKSLIYYLLIIVLAKLCGKKVIIFAQGIGPLNRILSSFLTKNILKTCDLLSVRDEKSLFLLRGWGVNASLQDDPVYNIEIPPYSPQDKVGIQLREWKNLSDEFLTKLATEVAKTFADREVLIFSFQDTLDIEICKKFQENLLLCNPYQKITLLQNNSPQNIVENFKNLEYLIAMRFHACLLAMKFGIKTLAINYDIKVENLAQSAQIPYLNLDKTENIEGKFEELKELKTSKLYEYANSKKYDFSEINELLSTL